MFEKSVDQRLSIWAELRTRLNTSQNPFVDVWEFWHRAPYVPYNKNVDPHYQRSWPSPWQIIVDNCYDDFTKALMIGWSIKMTDRFKDSKIQLKTLVDSQKHSIYNIVIIDEKIAINYSDNGPVEADKVPDTFSLENLIELNQLR